MIFDLDRLKLHKLDGILKQEKIKLEISKEGLESLGKIHPSFNCYQNL